MIPDLFARLRMWWYRRHMHAECVDNQLMVWRGLGLHVPYGACTKCLPRMEWMREQMTAKARLLP